MIDLGPRVDVRGKLMKLVLSLDWHKGMHPLNGRTKSRAECITLDRLSSMEERMFVQAVRNSHLGLLQLLLNAGQSSKKIVGQRSLMATWM